MLTFKGKHTTAGLDLSQFAGSLRDGSNDGTSDDRVDAFSMRRRCTKPVVVAMQDVCFTIGIEMMLGFDIVVAADDVRFCQMEPKRGLAVFGGAHVRYIQRAGWGNAMYHLLRADEFGATRALELGLAQEVVAAGTQVAQAHELATEIAQCAPLAVRAIKRAAATYLDAGERAAVDQIPGMRSRTANSADFKEGMSSFLEERDANFTGQERSCQFMG